MRWRSWLTLVGLGVLAAGCTPRVERRLSAPGTTGRTDKRAAFMKVHMKDGSLFVLQNWTTAENDSVIRGDGARYTMDRVTVEQGSYRIATADIAILETNVVKLPAALLPLGVITGVSLGMTAYCAINPKACFGSCPMFYSDAGDGPVLQAEGFSSSIAPVLEESDVDHLYRSGPRRGALRLEMVNEALETHVVRYAHLHVVPLKGTQRAFQDLAGSFWYTTPPVGPTTCQGANGDCVRDLAAFDGRERMSQTDSADLGKRETVELSFDQPSKGSALVLASRQSLVSTYLFYQALGYMGSRAGEWLAALNRGNAAVLAAAYRSRDALGGIEVDVALPDGSWRRIGEVIEYGPLAADVRLIPLPDGTAPVRIRLTMAQGAWRIDWAALATVEGRAVSQRVLPETVLRGRTPDLQALLDSATPRRPS